MHNTAAHFGYRPPIANTPRARYSASDSGDIYEYMLGKLSTAGTNGQFRTPRHIIELMVAMREPAPRDVMADPDCATCGLPVAVGEYLREHHPEIWSDT